MSACQEPFSIYEGETKPLLLTVFKNDGSGDIQNLAGATIELQVKPKIGDPDSALVISKTTPTEIVLADQTVGSDTEGQATVFFVSGDTTGKAGFYFYDTVAILAGGDRIHDIKPSQFTILSVVNQA